MFELPRTSDVSLPHAVAETLRALGEGLAELDVRWYLFGAQAVLVWGRPRLTADIDVTVDCIGTDSRAVVTMLEGRGWRLAVDDAERFVERTRVLPLLSPSGIPVDVVLAGPGIEEEFLAARRFVSIAGLEVPVISPEDLVTIKILAGRAKDLEDVAGVLALQGDALDLARIRRFLSSLEDALAQKGLVPEFERLLAEQR